MFLEQAASSSWKKCFYAGSHIMSLSVHAAQQKKLNKYNKSPCIGKKMNWMQQLAKVIMQICVGKMSTKKCHHQASGKSFWSGRFTTPSHHSLHTYLECLKNFVVYACRIYRLNENPTWKLMPCDSTRLLSPPKYQ